MTVEAYEKLRKQPAILYRKNDEDYQLKECIIDLDQTSQPSQIIVALLEPKASLAETMMELEKKIAEDQMERYGGGFDGSAVLIVPDIFFDITHHFAELEGRRFVNAAMKGQVINRAQQDVMFKLDRSGAELRSEAKVAEESVSPPFIFNRPFLVVMKKRGAEHPYFVMWVDNAELLVPWQGD